MIAKNKKSNLLKFMGVVLALIMLFSYTSISAFATEPSDPIFLNENVTFSNLGNLSPGESVEFETTDNEGNPITMGVELVERNKRTSGKTWKVYYYTAIINSHFYMDVTNNRVTSVYDRYVLTVGATASDISLTKTTTYGKLDFVLHAFGGLGSATCWLKGTVTGSDNNIIASRQY